VKIARDSRSRKSKVAFLDRVKKEYGFKENLARRNEFYKAIDTTYFQKAWSPEKVAKLNKEIFRIGDKVVYQQDFAKYLAANQPRGKVADVPAFIDRSYQTFSEDYITSYEDARLEGKYPEFKMLMQEYHDGILLFDLTDEKVWSKAVKDSAGLAAFYEAHKTENMWGERLEAVVYNAADAATAKAVKKNIKSRVKNGYTDEDILKMANGTSQLNLELERGKYSKGDNGLVDQIPWKKGVSSDIAKDNRVYFIEVIGILPAQPKELNEIKGLMTSAYQDSLEKQWLAELKSKYDVKVYKENLTKIK
jgi:peptidyl-prolyl cis-trans isomerase SurA